MGSCAAELIVIKEEGIEELEDWVLRTGEEGELVEEEDDMMSNAGKKKWILAV